MSEDRQDDSKKLEQALEMEFPDKHPDSVEYMGQRYIHERFVNMCLQSNPAMRKKLEQELKALDAKKAELDEREDTIRRQEEYVITLQRRLESATEELRNAQAELRRARYSSYSSSMDEMNDKGMTTIQQAIADTSSTVVDYEEQIRQMSEEIEQKANRISELEAELTGFKTSKA